MTNANGLLALALLLASAALCAGDGAPRLLKAEAFGAVGDGKTDDGPAIARMMAEAVKPGGPVRLQFGTGRTYYVKTSSDRYVFRFRKASQLTLDGGGSTFLLDPYLRFLSLTECRNATIRSLKVDFSPLPFAEGTVTGVNATARYLTVQLAPGFSSVPAGGPTGEDGEQAFYSMLWFDGAYGPLGLHYWTKRLQPGPQAGTVCVYAAPDFNAFDQIQPGKWRISLPVPGIADRFGPGACFDVAQNDTATFEDIELWSAPWMGFSVARNVGKLAFRRVSIRPKPGSGRLMSTWRDGFHVKGNSASLLWEDCIVSGMNDDAFNISTHSSAVDQVLSPTQLAVHQRFPLLPIPWRAGATLVAADEATHRLLGTARVTAVQTGPEPPLIQGLPAAPLATLTLDHPIAGLAPGAMIWDPGQCNPDTTLRRCRIEMSCRLQSPVHIEKCQVTALLWFYAESIEGGFPHDVTITDSVLKRGRGNPTLAVVFSGAPTGPNPAPDAWAGPRAVHDMLLKGNEIWGGFVLEGTERARLTGNRFLESGAQLSLKGNLDLTTEGNTDAAGEALPR